MKHRFFSSKRRGSLDADEIFVDSVSALGGKGSVESKLERPLERVYTVLFLVLVLGGIGYLLFRSIRLSVSRGDEFFRTSQENRFFVRPIFPPRGLIFDTFSQPLVENMPAFGLLFEKSLFLEKKGDLPQLVSRLSVILGKPTPFFWEAGFPEDYVVGRLSPRFIVAQALSTDDLLSIAPHLDSLPGISVFEYSQRRNAAPFAFSHVFGFVGKVSSEDLKERPALHLEDLVGKSGLEAFYDHVLRGQEGKKIVEVDARGRVGQFKFIQEPKEGSPLFLTLDGELQRRIYELVNRLTNGVKGASVVAIDPRDGAIRALVSVPGFDSNQFGASLAAREFDAVVQNPLTPLFNRAIAGEFPSGSTIKPLIALAALEEKIIDPQKKIYDKGFIEIPNPYRPGERSVFLDWRKHGWVDLYDAIAYSANVYFYMAGGGYLDQGGLGIERIKRYAEFFGFGLRLGIDLPGEQTGFIPDPSTKPMLEPQNPEWRIGDTYNVSIGQGGVTVTPLQMAVFTAAIANGGILYRPHLLHRVGREDGMESHREPEVIRKNIVTADSLRHVVKGMRQTVTSGTAGLLQGLPVAAAAKTGTAQAGPGLPHAWVTAFAPIENPTLAIAVMVEHAGEGSTVAVPIAFEILKWYFENRKKDG